MPAPNPPPGYRVEAVRSWVVRCDACGAGSEAVGDAPSQTINAAEHWAISHAGRCPAKESVDNPSTRDDAAP